VTNEDRAHRIMIGQTRYGQPLDAPLSAIIAAALDEAEARERAAVVAWLRDVYAPKFIHMARRALLKAADRIERAEHRKATDDPT
jgi:hypothetical protein